MSDHSSQHRTPSPPPQQLQREQSCSAFDECSELFVSGIHPYLTEEGLTMLFEKYGRVE